ncbi:competence/damage-inducible protein A [Priestia koreensis]|uniref:competence/damage-inducible protein A n=1 Tax=Priestia koreensis TaxID=284581 RepID=UPI001F59C34D|nr:competence/damage-inducible protein A [Priestia koreensis]MCM3003685.1 competence/damage-inducible protein A [Priestia koreensis]UNL83799.1 competence/damage-inducible protein A [Priestia koreensis]
MNAEIIAVGSELLLGQIANTNAQFLSKQLAEIGINVFFHTVVGDNEQRLEDTIHQASKRADLIIFTGGLGPTKDDLTKETIARVLGKSLVTDEQAMRSIEMYFEKTGRTMTPNNRKQALVLEGASVLTNDYGMAPGMAIEVSGKRYMLFPGPPKELQPMFLNHGRAYLLNQLAVKERIESRVLRFFGIGESQLETEIEDLLEAQTNPTIAPLAGDGEVTLRITAKHESLTEVNRLIDEAEAAIMARVGEFFYGYNETTLPSELVRELEAQKLTIASAESLTGGLFSERLTEIPGTSQIVKGAIISYQTEVKNQVLNVRSETIEKHGVVSEQCAIEMAEQVMSKLGSDIGVSFTGVAGPGTQEDQPVGTVHIAIARKNEKTKAYLLQLSGGRQAIRMRSVRYACQYLLKELRS